MGDHKEDKNTSKGTKHKQEDKTEEDDGSSEIHDILFPKQKTKILGHGVPTRAPRFSSAPPPKTLKSPSQDSTGSEYAQFVIEQIGTRSISESGFQNPEPARPQPKPIRPSLPPLQSSQPVLSKSTNAVPVQKQPGLKVTGIKRTQDNSNRRKRYE